MTMNNDNDTQRIDKLETQIKWLSEIVDGVAEAASVADGFAFTLLMLEYNASEAQASEVRETMKDLQQRIQGGEELNQFDFESSIEKIFALRPGSGHSLADLIVRAFQRERNFPSAVQALLKTGWFGDSFDAEGKDGK